MSANESNLAIKGEEKFAISVSHLSLQLLYYFKISFADVHM